MKLLFAITSLNQGGAERVLVDLVNELSNYHDITILTLYAKNDFEKELNKKVKLKSIYNTSYKELSFITKKTISLKLYLKSLRNKLYKKYINDEYDVNIAFLEGPMTWLLSCGKTKKIAWVHNDIEEVFKEFSSKNKKQQLNHESYKKYDELVFVSNSNLNKFNNYFKDIKANKRVITNYIDIKRIEELSKKDKVKFDTDNNFVQISRLVPQKNVSRLIDVHKKLIEDGYNHNIYIIGDGPLKEKLQNKIEELNVTETFHLLGGMNNPYSYLKSSDAFILTSDFEGYPVSIIEAKSLNKFIMITSSSANEAVEGYKDSLIVDNSEDGIYKGIKKLLKTDLSKEKNTKYTNNDIIDKVNELVSDK